MHTPLSQKSSIHDIRQRFDADVERFSVLETGQSATMDAPVSMDLITHAAIAATPRMHRILDIGCGAGNNALKLRQTIARDLDITLIDLSQPMLQRAVSRLSQINAGPITPVQADFRHADLGTFDVILAAAVLHHLRDDADWEQAFQKLFHMTAPGGSVWITDLVAHESPQVQQLLSDRYGDYLTTLGGEAYRNKVLAYIDVEDSPRPLTYQIDLLRKVGFTHVDLLHKNTCFAAFGATR